jgi:hypothetical protein
MEETPLEATPTFAAPGKRKINKRFIYLVITIFVIALLFFGSKLLGGNKTEDINDVPAVLTPTDFPTSTPEPTQSESPTPTTTSTPTPTKTVNSSDKTTGLDRSKLSITVQNGSGTVGAAGKASDFLKGLGYDVIGTGNADNYDYSNVVIQIKSSESTFLSLLKKDLSQSYTVGTTSANLSSSFSSDAVVIIGK